jgi:glycosyltransferase involved in cell wall biosynthesis
MLAGGNPCEACINNSYYHCFLKGCIGGSRAKSLLNTLEMYLHHNILHLYDIVDHFISPSKFLKEEVEKMGFKPRAITILPNMLESADYAPVYTGQGGSIVYCGRLSKEKGLFLLLDAVKELKNVNLKIIGDGPLKPILEEKIRDEKIENTQLLGYRAGEELKELIRASSFVVVPSEWYENNPRTIIEAFALGKPVLGARIGGIPELVIENRTGLTFEPGDTADLRSKIACLIGDRDKIAEMGKNARSFVEQGSNAATYYKRLMVIYEQARTR